ncbi:Fe-S cluster assembly protein SufD, partial [Roseibium sp. RKSG952]|nr:Fe-S cluster assembly protein SufD [Roseibium sp. RKSG952]
MNASMPIKHTQAEADLIERFDASSDRLPGSALSGLRSAAVDRIRESGLPHRRVEEYKYTDLRAFMKSAAPLAGAADLNAVNAILDARQSYGDLDRYLIVIANGQYMADVSDASA